MYVLCQFVETAACEDEQTIAAHVAMLQSQAQKRDPDLVIISSRMAKTYSDRRAMVYNGVSTKLILEKYPTLKLPEQVIAHCDLHYNFNLCDT